MDNIKNCPFCFYRELEIISESKNFCIIKDQFPTVEGHILVIPKMHIRSEEELNQSMAEEFITMRKKAFFWVKKHYHQDPFIFVNGLESMTVYHMHWHYMPCKWLKPFKNKNGAYTHGIAKAFNLYKEYMSKLPLKLTPANQ